MYPDHSLISTRVERKDCAAGPCSASFGLCAVSCSEKLGYICMKEKTPPMGNLDTNGTNSNGLLDTSSSESSTDVSSLEHSFPAMGILGRMMMRIAERVLPDIAMDLVSRFMHRTNGMIYSGNSSNVLVYYRVLTLFQNSHLMIFY